MVKNHNDNEWAWTGRESPFQKKLAALRNDSPSQTPAKGQSPYQPPLRAPETAAVLRETLLSYQQVRPEELEGQALLDSLTGLLNARQFMQKLEYELKRGMRYKRPVAICLLCIDGIKEVRRMYGAEAADRLIKLAADAIVSCVREVDFPARYSTDTLAVIFPETNANGVRIPAERIRQKIRKQVTEIGGETVYITASLGCATFPAHLRA